MCADRKPVGGLDGRPVLPVPAGWTEQRFSLRFTVSVCFLTVLALGASAEAAWAFGTGRPVPGALIAAGAAVIGHVAGFGIYVWRTPRRSRGTGVLTTTPEGAMGVRFGYSAWAYYWLTAVLILTELGLLVVIVVAAATATIVGAVVAAVVGVTGLAIGWFLVTVLRLAPGEITLSRVGVYHRSLTFTHFAPWHTVFDVSTGWLGTPIIVVKAYPSQDTRVRRYGGWFGARELQFIPFMVVRTYWLADDPATVYHALSFYHSHPDLQPELAKPDALNRISTGRAVGGEERS
jgi:hypothetical protein